MFTYTLFSKCASEATFYGVEKLPTAFPVRLSYQPPSAVIILRTGNFLEIFAKLAKSSFWKFSGVFSF